MDRLVVFIFLLMLLSGTCLGSGSGACPSRCVKCNMTKIDCESASPLLKSVGDLRISKIMAGSILTLDMAANELTELRANDLARFPRLIKLDLSHNKLMRVDVNAFSHSPNLTKINLGYNELTSLPDGLFSFSHTSLHLPTRSLMRNNWICDCHMRWMLNKDHGDVQCNEPLVHKGKMISTLKKSDLKCEDSNFALKITPSKPQIAFEGDTIPLECNVTGVQSLSEIGELYWLRNGVRREKKEKVDYTAITLSSLGPADSGKWYCGMEAAEGIKINVSVRLYVIKADAQYCSHAVNKTSQGVYYWPKTLSGITVEMPCKKGGGVASHTCGPSAWWIRLDLSPCHYLNQATEILSHYSKEPQSDSYVNLLQTVRKLPEQGDPIDLHFLAIIITKATEHFRTLSNVHDQLGESIFQLVSTCLSYRPLTLYKAETQYRAWSNMTESIYSVLAIVMKGSKHKTFNTQNIAARSFELSLGENKTCFAEAIPENISYSESNFRCETRPAEDVLKSHYKNMSVFLHIPHNLYNSTSPVKINVSVIVFKTHALDELGVKREGGITRPAPVIGLLTDSPGEDMQGSIQLGFPALAGHSIFKFKVENQTFKVENLTSSSSCSYEKAYKNVSLYRCTDIGIFGVSEVPLVEVAAPLPPHPAVYAGCALLFLTMVIIVVTYTACFRRIRMSRPLKHSLINVALSLLLLSASFSVSSQLRGLSCQILGITTHYLSLCSVFWITIYAWCLHKRITSAESSHKRQTEDGVRPGPKPMLQLYLFAWGIPIIICSITAAVNFGFYLPEKQHFCFVRWDSSLLSFFAVVTLLCLIIIGLLISSVINLARPQGSSRYYHHQHYRQHGAGGPESESRALTGPKSKEGEEEREGESATPDDCATLEHKHEKPNDELFIQSIDGEYRATAHLGIIAMFLVLYAVVWMSGALVASEALSDATNYAGAQHARTIVVYVFLQLSFILCLFTLGFFGVFRMDVRAIWSSVICRGNQERTISKRHSPADIDDRNMPDRDETGDDTGVVSERECLVGGESSVLHRKARRKPLPSVASTAEALPPDLRDWDRDSDVDSIIGSESGRRLLPSLAGAPSSAPSMPGTGVMVPAHSLESGLTEQTGNSSVLSSNPLSHIILHHRHVTSIASGGAPSIVSGGPGSVAQTEPSLLCVDEEFPFFNSHQSGAARRFWQRRSRQRLTSPCGSSESTGLNSSVSQHVPMQTFRLQGNVTPPSEEYAAGYSSGGEEKGGRGWGDKNGARARARSTSSEPARREHRVQSELSPDAAALLGKYKALQLQQRRRQELQQKKEQLRQQQVHMQQLQRLGLQEGTISGPKVKRPNTAPGDTFEGRSSSPTDHQEKQDQSPRAAVCNSCNSPVAGEAPPDVVPAGAFQNRNLCNQCSAGVETISTASRPSTKDTRMNSQAQDKMNEGHSRHAKSSSTSGADPEEEEPGLWAGIPIGDPRQGWPGNTSTFPRSGRGNTRHEEEVVYAQPIIRPASSASHRPGGGRESPSGSVSSHQTSIYQNTSSLKKEPIYANLNSAGSSSIPSSAAAAAAAAAVTTAQAEEPIYENFFASGGAGSHSPRLSPPPSSNYVNVEIPPLSSNNYVNLEIPPRRTESSV